MKKLIKLIFPQILNNKGMFLLVVFEMVIAIVTFNIAFSGLYDLWTKERLYKQMDLSCAVAFKLTDCNDSGISRTYEKLKKDKRFTLLGKTQTGITTPSEYIIPLSNDFIKNINKPNLKGEWFKKTDKDVYSAVVANNMRDKYKIGRIYTINTNTEKFKIYVSGILESNYMFIPPSGESDIIQENRNLILIDSNDTIINDNPSENVIITAYINGDINQGINILNKEKNIKNVMSVSTAKDNDSQILLRENSIPIILTIVVIFMCIAGFAGHNVLSIVQKEKQLAIFFLSGATKTKCVLLQLIEDIITILIPIVLSFTLLYFLKFYGLEKAFCNIGLILSAIMCAVIFLITSLFGLLKLFKKEPIEIIRQW